MKGIKAITLTVLLCTSTQLHAIDLSKFKVSSQIPRPLGSDLIVLFIGSVVGLASIIQQIPKLPSISVPSDPNAKYSLLDIAANSDQAAIFTVRESAMGRTFTKRLYDCEANTVRVMGTGDSWEEMNRSAPDPSNSPIVAESIAYYIGKKACNR